MDTTSPLRLSPLSIGQILDQAVRLYRRNFLKFIGIFAVVQIPASLLTIISSAQSSTSMLDYLRQASDVAPDETFWSTYIVGMSVMLLLGIATFILVNVIGTAALTKTVTNYLTGQSTDILEAYNNTSAGWGRLLVTVVVIALVFLAALTWTLLVPCIGWVTGPSILVFLSWVIGPLAIPIVVLEKKAGAVALRRAWDLARRYFWRMIGFALLLIIFSQILIAGPTALVQALFYSALNTTEDLASQSITLSIINSIVNLIFSLLYNPLQLTAFTLLYYDLRVRTEGFDLAILAQQTSSEVASAPLDYNTLIAHSPPAETGPLLTRSDYGKFALVSIIAIGIYLLIFLAIMFLVLISSAAYNQF